MSTDTATLSKKSASQMLGELAAAAEFDFKGERYAVMRRAGSVNMTIKKLSDGKEYRLNARAIVQNVEEFFYPLQQEKMAALAVTPTAHMGDLVRVKEGRFGGKVGIIAKVNENSYHIAVWKSPTIIVGFDAIERIDDSIFITAMGGTKN